MNVKLAGMETNFWLERWQKHEIGFHQPRVNDYLVAHWRELSVPRNATVFVPLCGKTLDMRWLSEQGHPVLGVDIARTACSEFFEELGLTPSVTSTGEFERWAAQGVALMCGDFFELTPAHLENVGGVFDRAALIALPPASRKAYASKLQQLVPAAAPILLVAPDYDQREMNGPPFAVAPDEIRALFTGCRIDELAAVDVTDSPDNARFRQRGVTKLIERVLRITRQAGRNVQDLSPARTAERDSI